MRSAFYMNIVSPHQLPLAYEIVHRVEGSNFRYVYDHCTDAERVSMGWSSNAPDWCLSQNSDEAREWLENADVLVCGLREPDLFERRCRKNLITFYTSERWFKPPLGMFRMLVPSYFKMVRRFVRLAKNAESFALLPIGVHARKDFRRIGIPDSKMMTWGYFVAPAERRDKCKTQCDKLRVLWVGRFLKLKNVDVLIRAVREIGRVKGKRFSIELTLVGDGPEKESLLKLAQGMENVVFMPSVKIEAVRDLMRTHDVYVFPSNGYDGWGAVVSEALEEGMIVVGSNQAGASATMLPESHRFDCRDWRRLAELLQLAAEGKLARIPIGEWSAKRGAERFLALCGASR